MMRDMKTDWGNLLRSLFLGTVLVLAATGVVGADIVENTGTIENVPGFPGKKLKYRVGAEKTGKRTAGFWLQIKNEEAMDIKIVVCAMVNLIDVPDIDDSDFNVEKVDGKWKCSPRTPDPGGGPPSFHFGCKQVTIPAGQKVDVFDTVAKFAQDFTAKELGKVYFDILKDCEITMCDQIKGANNFLRPTDPEDHADWVNVWADQNDYVDLTSTGKSFAKWYLGNWVTMGHSGFYPSRMLGTLRGAPTGALVNFLFDGVPGSMTYTVAQEPDEAPCVGAELVIDELVTIPLDLSALVSMSVDVPKNSCGFADEGEVMRFHADVFAESGTPFYLPGDFMHAIDMVFVRDTVGPEMLVVDVVQVPGKDAVRVDLHATDTTTMVIGATIRFTIDGNETEEPIDYAVPASSGNTMLFSDEFSGLPLDTLIGYEIDVYDELGNVTATIPATIVLSPPPPPGDIPTVSEWGLIILTLLGMTAGTIMLGQRRRPATAAD